ncbi:hypothetical protein MMYC01_205087 [Madurella mycetomatis]|uniref:Uncharacterized protein n=1 Tax=Madurella mycetomatis TaxID=100816 RepID=A0A175W3U0_9PEZI|nr:hypothetical protein MMYC01_205087 [Madurella mycetomatis]
MCGLALALLTIRRLLLLRNDPDWDATIARQTVDYPGLLTKLDQKFEQAYHVYCSPGLERTLAESDMVSVTGYNLGNGRGKGDFEVFLRVLEYYHGILFLTTNRIGDFNEAFVSRIHISLHYPEPDEFKTKRVFKLSLGLTQERFGKQGRKIMYDESSIQDFAEQHFREHPFSRWNGRQIRNASLQLNHFRLVQAAYLDFGSYLGDIRGTKGDRRAFDFSLRAKTNTAYQIMPSRFSTATAPG